MNRSATAAVMGLVLLGCMDGGVSLVVLDEAGATCPADGVAIDSGIDRDGDGQLAADETAQTRYVCDGSAGAEGMDGANGVYANQAGGRGVGRVECTWVLSAICRKSVVRRPGRGDRMAPSRAPLSTLPTRRTT